MITSQIEKCLLAQEIEELFSFVNGYRKAQESLEYWEYKTLATYGRVVILKKEDIKKQKLTEMLMKLLHRTDRKECYKTLVL